MASFTSPKTWAVGDVLTAADMNTFNRDNITDLDERLDLIESASGAKVTSSETTSSTTYGDLATAGPAVTITTGAKALVIVEALIRNNTAGAHSCVSAAVSGATTLAGDDDRALAYESSNADDFMRASTVVLYTGLTAGANTFTAKYRVNAGTGSFSNRRLAVIPLGE